MVHSASMDDGFLLVSVAILAAKSLKAFNRIADRKHAAHFVFHLRR